MKANKVLFLITMLLLLLVLVSTSCTFECIKPPPPIDVAFKSFHGRYVTAMGEDHGWVLRQETILTECGRFTQHHLANGKIALETCHGRYVTAPEGGTERQDWLLGQESKLGKYGQFDLYEFGNDRVAFKTRARKFFTAGDGNWPAPLQWSLVAETGNMEAWEIFTSIPTGPLPAKSVIADFDSCTDQEGLFEPIEPSPGNSLVVSYVPEEGRGCVARLEYDIDDWAAFLIRLQGADLSPYRQLVYDVKADLQGVPEQVKIELKRADLQEVSILYLSGITTNWQTMSVSLTSLGPTDYTEPLSSFTDMEELLFTFGAKESGSIGVVYLDNIAVRRAWDDL
jgi:hypothetical protein